MSDMWMITIAVGVVTVIACAYAYYLKREISKYDEERMENRSKRD
jgi:hypothetical protein